MASYNWKSRIVATYPELARLMGGDYVLKQFGEELSEDLKNHLGIDWSPEEALDNWTTMSIADGCRRMPEAVFIRLDEFLSRVNLSEQQMRGMSLLSFFTFSVKARVKFPNQSIKHMPVGSIAFHKPANDESTVNTLLVDNLLMLIFSRPCQVWVHVTKDDGSSHYEVANFDRLVPEGFEMHQEQQESLHDILLEFRRAAPEPNNFVVHDPAADFLPRMSLTELRNNDAELLVNHVSDEVDEAVVQQLMGDMQKNAAEEAAAEEAAANELIARVVSSNEARAAAEAERLRQEAEAERRRQEADASIEAALVEFVQMKPEDTAEFVDSVLPSQHGPAPAPVLPSAHGPAPAPVLPPAHGPAVSMQFDNGAVTVNVTRPEPQPQSEERRSVRVRKPTADMQAFQEEKARKAQRKAANKRKRADQGRE